MTSPPSPPIERQFQPVEIAHIMHKNVKTVLGWLRDPEHPLTGHKVGNQWYVPQSHLAAFLRGEFNAD